MDNSNTKNSTNHKRELYGKHYVNKKRIKTVNTFNTVNTVNTNLKVNDINLSKVNYA